MTDPSGRDLQAELRALRRHLAELEESERRSEAVRRRLAERLDALLAGQAPPEPQPPERVEPAEAASDPARILIAEDSPTAARLARRAVERAGYTATVVEDGLAALEALGTASFAAVLMDCEMPRMDGFQATRAIRQLAGPAHQVPVIALTARTAPGEDLRCFVAGMDDYLPKPIDAARLAATLDRWVGEPRAKRA